MASEVQSPEDKPAAKPCSATASKVYCPTLDAEDLVLLFMKHLMFTILIPGTVAIFVPLYAFSHASPVVSGGSVAAGETAIHTFTDNGTYLIALDVTDTETLTTSDSANVDVLNTAPRVDTTRINQTTLNVPVLLEASFEDPGSQLVGTPTRWVGRILDIDD